MLELRKLADKSGDIRGHVNLPDDKGTLPWPDRAEGELVVPWPLAGVELIGKVPSKHNFSDDLVKRGTAEGWLEITELKVSQTAGYSRGTVVTGAAIVLHLVGGDLTYTIDRCPGRYSNEEIHEYRCTLAKEA